eukprot:scaffold9333_cov32-Tisochrysis_lutea.AAC.1
MFNQTVAEATGLGFFMAFWWRSSHQAQKARCTPSFPLPAPYGGWTLVAWIASLLCGSRHESLFPSHTSTSRAMS